MLDINFIRKNPDIVQAAIEAKGIKLDIQDVLEADEILRDSRHKLDGLRRTRNELTDQFKTASTDERAALTAQSKEVKEGIATLEPEEKKLSDNFQNLMWRVPNIPAKDAPIGKDESDNVVVETHGTKPVFDFPIRDHVDLLEQNNWADFGRITPIAGARSYMLKGDVALLEMGLHALALRRMAAEGFTIASVPSMARDNAFYGSGHFPDGREEVYTLEKDALNLSGTAEIVLTSLHSGEILNENDLPMGYAALSPCFRREAGSAGRDVRGLLRVHQFYKVEQFVICKNDPDESAAWHKKLLSVAKGMLNDLELHYQVVACCTGDMGAGKVRMHDIETWLPSADKFRETHSCSTFHDWQARRANLRYRDKNGDVTFAHTLNNTVIATPRVLAQFLETHQQQDGSVYIPKPLREFVAGQETIGGTAKKMSVRKTLSPTLS